LEQVIIRAGREGHRVYIGNAVSVVIVDIGNKDARLLMVLSNVMPLRPRIVTGRGSDRSYDTESGENIPDRWKSFSALRTLPTGLCRTHDSH